MIIKGRILDGTGSDPIEKGVIVVKDGELLSVGQVGDVELPKKDKIVDARGKTIIPGLIDGHNHYVHSRPYEEFFGQDACARMRSTLLGLHNARLWIDAGITTVRDYGGDLPGIVALRQEIDAGRIPGPRTVFVAGHRLKFTSNNKEPKGPKEVREAAEEWMKAGIADWVSIRASGGFTDNAVWDVNSTVEEITAATEVAHSHGKRVDVMAMNPESGMMACEAGADCITHGAVLNEEALEAMKKHNVFWAPAGYTLVASTEWDIRIQDSDISILLKNKSENEKLQFMDTMKKNAKIMEKAFKSAYEIGVSIVPGSDVPPPREDAIIINPDALVSDLDLIMRWTGMSPMEGLMAITQIGAKMLGLEDQIGTLEKGKIADLVIVKGDPLGNLRKALDPANIWLVMKEGRIISTENNRARLQCMFG